MTLRVQFSIGAFPTLIGSKRTPSKGVKNNNTTFALENTMLDHYTFVGDDVGMTPAEYGYLWIKDCCPMHQWCSGARPVDQGVIDYCETLVEDVRKNVKGDHQPDYDWAEEELENLETLLRYLKANLGTTAEEKDGSFQTSNLGMITYSQVREANTDLFQMEMHGDDAVVIAQALLVGIDSHLEACFVKERGDQCLSQQVAHIATLNDEKVIAPYCCNHPNFLKLVISAKSLPVLLRRLCELDFGNTDLQDEARSLADDILETIGLGDA
jgi:hypothetical protein